MWHEEIIIEKLDFLLKHGFRQNQRFEERRARKYREKY